MPQVSNLDERVRESLRDQIISGQLEGGFHLSELKLSKEFSVSRTPVREALCALAADGLIEMVPHRGAFVREQAPTTATDQANVYSYLMASAAGMATERADIEWLLEVEGAAAALETSDNFGASLESFMNAIQAASQNPTLDEMIGLLDRRMDMTAFYASATAQKDDIKQSITYLLGAFKRHKAEAAEKTMRELVGKISTGPSAAQTAAKVAGTA